MRTIRISQIATGAACLLGLAVVAVGPTTAAAQNGPYAQSNTNTQGYDGYCYQRQGDSKATGTVVGAIAGAVVGSQVSKNERGLGTVAGAVIGGTIGRNIGKDSVKCLNGEYYAYQGNAYEPSAAPDGYEAVYFQARPSQNAYDHVYYSRDKNTSAERGYPDRRATDSHSQGWRDDSGQWHMGRQTAVGWRDDRGQWHVGSLQAYGWVDGRGQWHETPTNQAGGSRYNGVN